MSIPRVLVVDDDIGGLREAILIRGHKVPDYQTREPLIVPAMPRALVADDQERIAKAEQKRAKRAARNLCLATTHQEPTP